VLEGARVRTVLALVALACAGCVVERRAADPMHHSWQAAQATVREVLADQPGISEVEVDDERLSYAVVVRMVSRRPRRVRIVVPFADIVAVREAGIGVPLGTGEVVLDHRVVIELRSGSRSITVSSGQDARALGDALLRLADPTPRASLKTDDFPPPVAVVTSATPVAVDSSVDLQLDLALRAAPPGPAPRHPAEPAPPRPAGRVPMRLDLWVAYAATLVGHLAQTPNQQLVVDGDGSIGRQDDGGIDASTVGLRAGLRAGLGPVDLHATLRSFRATGTEELDFGGELESDLAALIVDVDLGLPIELAADLSLDLRVGGRYVSWDVDQTLRTAFFGDFVIEQRAGSNAGGAAPVAGVGVRWRMRIADDASVEVSLTGRGGYLTTGGTELRTFDLDLRATLRVGVLEVLLGYTLDDLRLTTPVETPFFRFGQANTDEDTVEATLHGPYVGLGLTF
jgi:hypothetical protein